MFLILFNPWYLNLSFSFMTEIYGFCVAFFGVWAWLKMRTKTGGAKSVSWSGAHAAALLIGASFWIRQFCAILFPALWIATLASLLLPKNKEALKKSIPPLLSSGLLFTVSVALYFPWAKSTGN
ncbi:MAG: hypothetical protein ACXWOH_12485, partial [Bdellovibrionota bacterium]